MISFYKGSFKTSATRNVWGPSGRNMCCGGETCENWQGDAAADRKTET